MVRHVRTPLYRPGGLISGFEIVLHLEPLFFRGSGISASDADFTII